MKRRISKQSTVTAITDQVSCDLQGEAVILNFQSGIYYGLNQVGARIWKLIQQPRLVNEILGIILNEYNVESQRCELDLLNLLEELNEAGLIHVEAKTSA